LHCGSYIMFVIFAACHLSLFGSLVPSKELIYNVELCSHIH
jgi:hypothetical protein